MTRAADDILESSSDVIAKGTGKEQSSGLNSLKSTWVAEGGGNAIAGAGGSYHVVKGQDAPTRIIAAPINEVDGHAAAPIFPHSLFEKKIFFSYQGGFCYPYHVTLSRVSPSQRTILGKVFSAGTM